MTGSRTWGDPAAGVSSNYQDICPWWPISIFYQSLFGGGFAAPLITCKMVFAVSKKCLAPYRLFLFTLLVYSTYSYDVGHAEKTTYVLSIDIYPWFENQFHSLPLFFYFLNGFWNEFLFLPFKL